jgi:alpha-beta hydrolase superfamily lysophospholipase
MSGPSHTVETFTASDGYALKFRRYRAVQNPLRAHVVCIHGIQSHGGWYEHSCSRLAERGFQVDFLDRRGSGLNQQDRGDTPSFRRLLDDLAEFLRSSRIGQGDKLELADPQESPHPRPLSSEGREEKRPPSPPSTRPSPIFLLGISWGGKLALALQRRQPGLIDGLVLLCPGIFAQVKPSLKERLRILWSRIVSPRRKFPIPLNNPELFTTNRLKQQFIRNDPLALHDATARFLIESVRLDRYLRAVPKHVNVPVLLMLAERDRIIDNDRTRKFVETFASTDWQVIEYVGAHHTLEFEVDPEPFIRDLGNWLEKHCQEQRGP